METAEDYYSFCIDQINRDKKNLSIYQLKLISGDTLIGIMGEALAYDYYEWIDLFKFIRAPGSHGHMEMLFDTWVYSDEPHYKVAIHPDHVIATYLVPDEIGEFYLRTVESMIEQHKDKKKTEDNPPSPKTDDTPQEFSDQLRSKIKTAVKEGRLHQMRIGANNAPTYN